MPNNIPRRGLQAGRSGWRSQAARKNPLLSSPSVIFCQKKISPQPKKFLPKMTEGDDRREVFYFFCTVLFLIFKLCQDLLVAMSPSTARSSGTSKKRLGRRVADTKQRAASEPPPDTTVLYKQFKTRHPNPQPWHKDPTSGYGRIAPKLDAEVPTKYSPSRALYASDLPPGEPRSPAYSPTSPAYSPTYRPTSPALCPTSPIDLSSNAISSLAAPSSADADPK